jgi:tRNA-2-methylthio-N6-dimethylallyladenosine synthase
MSRHYWFEIYGCEMNKAEGEALEIALASRGWEPAARAEEADLVLLHTCAVRATAENRLWGRLGHYKALKDRQGFTLVVSGCMAQRLQDGIRERAGHVDAVLGPAQLHRLDAVVEDLKSGQTEQVGMEEGPYHFRDRHSRPGAQRAYVPVMHGCNNFCTYCIVPYVRGREVSRSPESIVSELADLEADGVKDVTLLGQNVNSYRWQAPDGQQATDFPSLIRFVLERTPGIPWLRFLTSHPKDLSDALIDAMASLPRLCRHIHLPVQHGSDRILRAMNRRYTRADYLSLVGRIRKALGNVAITTDVMVGFPGETDGDVSELLELMQEAYFSEAFTYYYNPREGTRAYELGDTVPHHEKLARLERVIQVQRELTRQSREAQCGREVTVLVEDVSKKRPDELLGRTERNEMVVFPGSSSRVGTFVSVSIAGVSGNTLRGEENALCRGA